jgi:hypothetical protein
MARLVSFLLILEMLLTAVWLGLSSLAFWRVSVQTEGIEYAVFGTLGLLLLAVLLLTLSLLSETGHEQITKSAKSTCISFLRPTSYRSWTPP